MFDSIAKDLKYQFQKKHSVLGLLIIINVAVFVILNLAYFISRISPLNVYTFLGEQVFKMYTDWDYVLYRPWTVITTFFSQENFMHLLSNMLGLYWFGTIIEEFINEKRLLSLYLLGGIVSSAMVLLLCNLIPYYENHHNFLLGASGAVFAVSVAAATIAPDYEFNLLLLGPVKIKWIVLVYLFLSLIGTVGDNSAGNIAHMGGAVFGYLYIHQLKNGRDFGRPFIRFFEWVSKLFKKRSPIKVSYRNNSNPSSNTTPNQKEIDDILDKISRSGYESLTKEEKQKLFKASQK
ncbi:MAG TPA: rhomboid family intramembrane serine protease [Cytophagaceae bacterium]|nr:rhomboid family intramembrane serine protease [Cytophagaceae bacterium]